MTLDLRKLLHHRKPYLMIDEVVDHSPTFIQTIKVPKAEEFYLQGHFPHVPVVPGAMMQEMATQSAGVLITQYYSPVPDYDSEKTKGHALGVLRAVHLAKFKSFARPEDVLKISVHLTDRLETSFRFKAVIESGDTKIMYLEFTLVNIEESKLFGEAKP